MKNKKHITLGSSVAYCYWIVNDFVDYIYINIQDNVEHSARVLVIDEVKINSFLRMRRLYDPVYNLMREKTCF
jgi:hypothetical protein